MTVVVSGVVENILAVEEVVDTVLMVVELDDAFVVVPRRSVVPAVKVLVERVLLLVDVLVAVEVLRTL